MPKLKWLVDPILNHLMRQINFALIFILCLALALFSIENSQPTAFQVVPGVTLEAPLSIELIVAMGIGSVGAWLFSIWNRWLYQLGFGPAKKVIRVKDEQIDELQQEVEHWKAEIDKQKPFLPSSEVFASRASTAEVEIINH